MDIFRAYHLIKKEFIQMIRDPRVVFLIFVPPIIQLLIFGYVATTDVRHIALAICDQDNTALSRTLVERFTASPNFDIKYRVRDERGVRDLIDGGSVVASLDISLGFEKKVLRGEEAPVQMILNGGDSNFALIAGGYAQTIISRFSNELLKEKLVRKGFASIKLKQVENVPRVWFNEDLKSVNFMIPGIVAMLIAINTMILSALGVVKEKEHGTLEQLIVTPIKPAELLCGKMVPYIITTYIQILLAVLVGVFWFKVPFRGDLVLLMALSFLFLVPSLGLGLFISLVSRTQYQAFMSGFLVILPTIMLSGFIFPIRNMPYVIQLFTYLLPIRYFLEIIRGIFLKGVGIEYLWGQVIPLIILGVLIFGVAVSRFRKKLS